MHILHAAGSHIYFISLPFGHQSHANFQFQITNSNVVFANFADLNLLQGVVILHFCSPLILFKVCCRANCKPITFIIDPFFAEKYVPVHCVQLHVESL